MGRLQLSLITVRGYHCWQNTVGTRPKGPQEDESLLLSKCSKVNCLNLGLGNVKTEVIVLQASDWSKIVISYVQGLRNNTAFIVRPWTNILRFVKVYWVLKLVKTRWSQKERARWKRSYGSYM